MLLNCSYSTTEPMRYVNSCISSFDYIAVDAQNYVYMSFVGMIYYIVARWSIKWQGCL